LIKFLKSFRVRICEKLYACQEYQKDKKSIYRPVGGGGGGGASVSGGGGGGGLVLGGGGGVPE